MKLLVSIAVLLVAGGVADVARSGHEFPVYPSYYPHEVRIETVGADRAPALLAASKIQAYMGALDFGATRPASVSAVESLGSLIVVRVNPQSEVAGDPVRSCSLIGAVVREAATHADSFRFHPYPVTPYDGDYLYYADQADAFRSRYDNPGTASDAAAPAQHPRVRAATALVRALVPGSWLAKDAAWDVGIDEVGTAALAGAATRSLNGWITPPWAQAGWYRALLLLGPAVDDADRMSVVRAAADRLESGAYATPAERVELERKLVATLVSNCRAVVAGYSVRRQYVSTEYTTGIENIGFDSVAGLSSPIFIRTAKLKDFPWNGWLAIGIDSAPTAAWNPVAGFTDSFGGLMWSAIGDPAMLPWASGGGWILNRISDVR